MKNVLATRNLRKNDAFQGSLKKQGELAEGAVLYTFAADQLRYIDSSRAELIVEEVTAGLRLPGTGRPNRRLAILSLLNACFEAYHNEPEEAAVGVLWPTSTSEEPESRYKRKLFSPPAKKKAVDNLLQYGYIKFYRGGKSSNSFVPGLVSLVIPTAKLRAAYEEVVDAPYRVVDPFEYDRELVVLKDESKRLVDYTDDGFTQATRARVRQINEINHSHLWHYTDKNGEETPIHLPALTLTRQFRENSFEVYGRFHCEAQGLRKSQRKSIKISGERTVELDFKAMLPTIAYAWSGMSSAELAAWEYKGDPYELTGYTRGAVKQAFLTCLNADSRRSAIQALLSEIVFENEQTPSKFVNSLIIKHSRIEHLFFSSAWRILSRKESDIMDAILTHCINFRRPVLAIHDGLVCRLSDEIMFTNFMRDAFERAYGITPEVTRKAGLPRYGDSSGVARPVSGVVN